MSLSSSGTIGLSNSNTVPPVQLSVLPKLPNEIWSMILSHVSRDPRHRSTCMSLALANRNFFNLCVNSVHFIQMFHVFNRIPTQKSQRLEVKSKKEMISTSEILSGCFRRSSTQLASDPVNGRTYMIADKKPYCLIILFNKKGLHAHLLHLPDEIEKADLKTNQDVNRYSLDRCDAHSLVACHLTEEGFILVTLSGYSIWKFNADNRTPTLSKYFVHFDGAKEKIESSSYQNDTLLICTTSDKHIYSYGNFYTINLCDEHPKSEPISFSTEDWGYGYDSLKDYERKFLRDIGSDRFLFFGTGLFDSSYICISIENRNGTNEIVLTKKEYSSMHTRLYFSNAREVLGSDSIFIAQYNELGIFRTNYTLIDIKQGKRVLCALSVDEYKNHVFVSGEFLFICHTGHPRSKHFCSVFHIPTRIDYTERLAPFFKSVGLDSWLYFASCDVEGNKFFLECIFVNRPDKKVFFEKFDIDLSKEASLHEPPSDIRCAKMSIQEVDRHHLVAAPRFSSKMAKIVFVVEAIFLAVLAVSLCAAVVLILRAKIVCYEPSKSIFIITMLSASDVSGLILIARCSYFCWKERHCIRR